MGYIINFIKFICIFWNRYFCPLKSKKNDYFHYIHKESIFIKLCDLSYMKLSISYLTNVKKKGRARHLPDVPVQLMKATVLAEISMYFIFSPGYLCSSDVYRRDSGRCRTIPFFLTFFIISPFQVFLLY